MTIRGWLLVLPAVFAIGCAADPSGPADPAPPPSEPATMGTDDLREASPEDESSSAAKASAKGRDAVVDQARADQLVGEEVSGYLAVVDDQDLIAGKNAPSDLDARVQTINSQRRALYTDLATKDGVTVDVVAQTTACALLREKVKVGEAYRTEASKWKVRTFDVPVSTPSYCATP